MRGAERRRDGGFTLIETLVAFAILAAAIASLSGALSDGLFAGSRAAEIERSIALARSVLARAEAAVTLAPGIWPQPGPDGLVAELRVSEVAPADGALPGLLEIAARVSDPRDGRTIAELVTLRAGTWE